MIKLIKTIYQSTLTQWQNKQKQENLVERIFKESNLVTEKQTDGGFTRINNPSDTEKGHVQGDQREMIRQSRKMFRFDYHARAIIQAITNYIVGKGFDIKPKSDDPRINFIWSEFWNSPRSNFRKKRFELVNRFFRDGEYFMEFFSKNEKNTETGLTTCRFVDPLLVKDPAQSIANTMIGNIQKIRSGVEIDPDDVETVVAYWVELRTETGKSRRVKAEDMAHLKAFADSDQRRGETLIQPIMRLINQYQNWLEQRIILNRMRTAVILIKKVQGTSSELENLKGTIGDVNQQGKMVIQGGKILIANQGVDYKMESPNINASDVKDDGRQIKLGMAAGTNLPEYVLGDASNANFASTLIAESPFVKSIEYWQIIFEEGFREIYRRVIMNAVKAGKLQPPSDKEFFQKVFGRGELSEAFKLQQKKKRGVKLTEDEEELASGSLETPTEIFFGCDIQWPEIIHRDLKSHTEALMIARQNGWISDSTASASLGYDYDEEVRKQNKIEKSATENGNTLLGVKSKADDDDDDSGQMDDEINNILGQMDNLSDEERQMILKTQNPMDIAKMILSRSQQNGAVAPAGGGNNNNGV